MCRVLQADNPAAWRSVSGLHCSWQIRQIAIPPGHKGRSAFRTGRAEEFGQAARKTAYIRSCEGFDETATNRGLLKGRRFRLRAGREVHEQQSSGLLPSL